MTIAKVAGGLEHAQQPLERPGVAVVFDTVRAATGGHAEQLGVGEVTLSSASPGPGVRVVANDLGVYEVNDTDGTINVPFRE